ncbi:hypothetical protein E3N88_46029 [Mikania micrantha]|uniref:RING-type E3 ubiquitin transferase n=1 Tax=Mikania micrantha TaxID=192012 RepID=A0A5N6L7Q6_9ASTR|nr:hypothetical protein E3N88_46029 [Mikania micrantha]
MAKSVVFERNPTDNLKKELQRLVKEIVEDSSSNKETGFQFTDCVDKATQILQALKDLKEGRTHGSYCLMNLDNCCSNTKSNFDSCPQEFNCPLSNQIMRDPVIISTGKTYDRPSIQKWLKEGNRTCPKTQQVLTHTVLTPNHLVRDMITKWCKNHGIGLTESEQGQYPDENGLTEADHNHFQSLLKKLSSSSSTIIEQKEAASTLRSLTKRIPSFRALFGESSNAIAELLTPLSQIKDEIDPDLHEDLITTLLNLSIHDSNKKLAAETPNVISILLHALRSGTIGTRTNAAATLFTLSALDSNKLIIGKSGGLKPLIDLLEEGHGLAMKDAASAIFNLCIVHENKGRAVRDGAVSVLLNKINHRLLVDELLAILAMLSSNQNAVEEMSDLGAVSCLFSLMKTTTCDQNKENCIAILYAICFNDRTKWREMREEESGYKTLSRLAQNGTSRAKRKANAILDRINRPVNRTHTA